ncbi:beta-xylosidase family glycoside hydrolase [Pantoea vagans]|uniref:beta-xylosidase family glycoside hydrolase n=1 Tax=Pantoea vagans TaxID=470934 RepID=UPI00289D2789|nr:hypothetical protein [Pantoea vagans]
MLINDLNTFSHPAGPGIDIESDQPVYLRVDVRLDAAFFYYSLDEQNWHSVGDYVEYSKLSDEYYKERGHERFTCTFVGLCCQDFTGENVHADFDYFLYEPLS